MSQASEELLTNEVLAAYGQTADPRQKEIFAALIKHLHAFAREVRLTEAEWFKGIDFLTRTGQKSDAKRQEFILLSDLLGLSQMVVLMNADTQAGATESTVLGPFYVAGAPEYKNGASLIKAPSDDPVLVVRGHVRNQAGKPIERALLDIWQADSSGVYHVQDPKMPEFNLCGRLRTDADGYYEFKTQRPRFYPVPTDGPAGELTRAAGRHPFRPGHVHAMVSAEGHATLVTHIFDADDKYLKSDAVFAVVDSLVRKFERHDSASEAQKLGVNAPFYTLEHDIVLQPDRERKIMNFGIAANPS
jgi:protocatechuate 3,4-dioxygenase beta subunit